MLKHNLKYSSVPSALVFGQLAAILVYLNENIVNIGEMGTALLLLATYFGLSCVIFIILWLQNAIYIRFHFLVFLFFVAWIALRVAIDLGDPHYLKAITLGTTGGILLFYLAGAFFNMTYVWLRVNSRMAAVHVFVIQIFLVLTLYLLINFFSRMRIDIFLIENLDGSYQRPGNFLSISFIIASVIFTSLLSIWSRMNKGNIKIFFLFSMYSFIAIVLLVSSQLIGSNSATAVIMGTYVLTFIVLLLIRNKKIQRLHADGRLACSMSKYMMQSVFRSTIIVLTLFATLSLFLIWGTGFDILGINLFGFGSGELNSITSRFEILIQTGMAQMGHSPFFGNMNVAYLVTGIEGLHLHSFFLFIFSNLGLIGLLLAIIFFFLIFHQLYRSYKLELSPVGCRVNALMLLYFIFILLFLLLFANFTADVTWIVIWFVVGFISQPFGFKSGKSNLRSGAWRFNK